MPASKEIAVLLAAIDENLDNAGKLSSRLTREQFNWHSEPGRWSIAQNFAHLNIVNGRDLTVLEHAIEDGRARGLTAEGPFRYALFGRKFAASQDLPVKGKFKAPKSFVPPPEADLKETIAEYTRIAGEVRRLALAADGLDLARIKIKLGALPAPLRAILKMQLGPRFTLLVNHDRRHVWQAGQVRSHKAFPK
jgi:hypothetical protein